MSEAILPTPERRHGLPAVSRRMRTFLVSYDLAEAIIEDPDSRIPGFSM